MRKQGFITLMFDTEAFAKDADDGSKLDDAMLRDFGRDMNEQAAHLLGYEGWITGWTNVPEESDHIEDANATRRKHERN